ncbi:VOC family protein [Streptomyces meridianus]|uniref:VOC family protein n=1 Tax=Streptomyces meridianus TaxID=2938945 RepID=A0ABT0X931_9ACTN|nr:VOC family protein [Streptomyces meridianus]MCM2579040.1 VOC family protein [Streptomyces meridianus]
MATDGFTTCLWFDGQAQEAAEFYVSVFENSAISRITRYNEAGPGTTGDVWTVEFTANGQKFLALNGGPQFRFNEAVSFQIMCDDQAEVDHYWNRLAEGGREDACGWVQDKYGLFWQVVPRMILGWIGDPDPEKAQRATEAMLSMVKFDIGALQKAYEGR